ncbi:uncharacterized protein LOC115927889 [Strongylocentrotus purpuratus]|nr:uncharacterized protein LOC115927889 [Strongylocentrotus purpuratus]
MKTNVWILIAVLALAWANMVVSYSSESDDDDNELTDEDLCDEGPPMDVETHKSLKCSCTTSYIVTSPDQHSYNRLFKKIDKLKACRDCSTIKRAFTDVLLIVSVETTEKCAIKLAKKGYLVEENSVQEVGAALPTLPVKLLDRIDQVDLPRDGASYDRNDATDVTIFILDTGVLFTHDEFTNGRVSFYNDTVTPNSPIMVDVNGHGTRCASVAAGANIGVAQGATVESIRVAGSDGLAAADDVLAGLDDVQRWWNNNPGSKCVVSYSLISTSFSTTLNYAFGNLSANTDCVVVVAAGNQGSDISMANACNYSPSGSPDVITVGGSRNRMNGASDDRIGISNYGPCVDIYAPARNIDLAAPSGSSNSNYLRSSGTSFATPAVAGAAAMILSTTSLTPTGSETMTDLVLDILIATSAKDKLTSLPASNAAVLPSFNRLLNVVSNTYYA